MKLSIKTTFYFIFLMLLSACAPSVFNKPYPIQAVDIYSDEAAHEAPVEWWYYTGHLEDDEGKNYGFELSFFQAYIPPRYKLFGLLPLTWLIPEGKGYVAHVALSDLDANNFYMDQQSDLNGIKASSSTEVYDVFVGDWSAKRVEETHILNFDVKGRKLTLTLSPEKAMVLHGDKGIQSMGEGGVSYYTSYTRMKVTGTLQQECSFLGLACKTSALQGKAWHDHQWGDFDIQSFAGWDWFSLQFDDNTELMLYLIRPKDDPATFSEVQGTFVDSEGNSQRLYKEDIGLEPTSTWSSETTGARYPMGWQITIAKLGINIAVEPLMLAQEMDTKATTRIVYWEGAVKASGSHEGLGYVELTNYDLYPFAGLY